jgi:predicted membrane chloride channel (bestrophin family)
MNTIEDLKLYCLNITSATVVSLGWLEPVLSVLLLLTTIGYTAHKWYLLKQKNK